MRPAKEKENQRISESRCLEHLFEQPTTKSSALSRVAPYYEQGAGHVYYDIAPLKYNGWQEYVEGYKKLIADYSSVKFTLGPDARAHQGGNVAWATATWKGELVKKDGTKETLEGRWTAVFEKRGDNWIIVHDHFSVPLPSPGLPKQ